MSARSEFTLISARSARSAVRLVATAACMMLVACKGADTRRDPPAAASATYGGTVDSAMPREEALRRFRTALPDVKALVGGAGSRDALVRAFVRAVEEADTIALARITLTRAEFAWLYYPTTPQSLPPYDLSPGLLWFLLEGNSTKGAHRLRAERGGRPLGYAGYRCDNPSREGENTVWGPCVVRRVRAPGDTVEERLFGPIIRRTGRYKLVSLANDF